MASSTYPQGIQRKQRCSEEAYAGPLEYALSPGSMHSNGRQRRHQESSVEQPSSDDIIITNFRVGGFVLCRLPAYGTPLGRDSPLERAWEASLANDVHQVLQRHHVLVSEAHALVRHSCRHEETTADTIFVLAERRHLSDDSWYLATVEIRQLCASQGLPHVNVEIADPRGLQPAFSHPVEHDLPVLGLWSAGLERRVVDVLGQSDWLALELLRRGVSPSQLDNPITITVTIDEASEVDWVDVRERLVAILDENRLGEVAVEIIRGVIRRGWTDEMCRPQDEEWGGKAVFGGSISPSRSAAGTGTLGGFLELQNPTGSWETFAFTCYHVVLPSGTGHPSLDSWSKHGIKPGDSTNHLTMDHPSYGDHLMAVRSWKEVIAGNQSDSVYQSVKASIDYPEAFVIPYHMAQYNSLEQQIQELDKKIRRAEAFFAEGKALLGPVFAASGMRQAQVATEYGPSLDWALIKLNKARISRNQLPPKSEVPSRFRDQYRPIYPTMSVTGVPGYDMPLFKCGRSTGITAGFYCGGKTTLLHSWKTTQEGLVHTVSRDHSVVAPPKWGEVQPIFASDGDSGAAVFNSRGEFLGIYFGGNEATNTSYFTGVDDLFGDMQTLIGTKAIRLSQ